LHGDGDTSNMINIGPSHEFHGGPFLLVLGWYFDSFQLPVDSSNELLAVVRWRSKP